jgi:hypothetical protein
MSFTRFAKIRIAFTICSKTRTCTVLAFTSMTGTSFEFHFARLLASTIFLAPGVVSGTRTNCRISTRAYMITWNIMMCFSSFSRPFH